MNTSNDNVKDLPVAHTIQGDGNDGPDGGSRFDQLFRDDRRRSVRCTIALTGLAVGISLWAINGLMRVDYQEAVERNKLKPAGAQTLTQGTATPSSASQGESSHSEFYLGALGPLLFLGVFAAFWYGPGPLAKRGSDMDRAVKRQRNEMQKALKRSEKTIRAFIKAEGQLIYAGKHAGNLADTVRSGGLNR